MHKLQIFLIVAIFVCLSRCTLTPKSPKSKKNTAVDKGKIGPQNRTVFDENLVVENQSSKDIINYHQCYYKNTKSYNVNGMVLGYVTPVNI